MGAGGCGWKKVVEEIIKWRVADEREKDREIE